MSGLLHRIAHWCFAHRWLVAAVWLVVLAATVTGAKVSGGQLDRGFTVPGSPSQIALNQVQQDFPASAGTSAQRQGRDRSRLATWQRRRSDYSREPVMDPDARFAVGGVILG
jgi:hypothetical protein